MHSIRAQVRTGAPAVQPGEGAPLAARQVERILPATPRRRRRRSGRSVAALALVLLAALVLVALLAVPANFSLPTPDWLRAEQPPHVWDLSEIAPAASQASLEAAPPQADPAIAEAAALDAAAPPPAAPALPQTPSGDAGILEIERLLERLSFAPGPVDGTLDAATRDAIRQYEETAGLPVTGLPSEPLLDELRDVSAGFTDEP